MKQRVKWRNKMQGLNIQEVAEEIKSLSNIANYGGVRLNEFGNRATLLTQQLANATTYHLTAAFLVDAQQFHNTILASHKAITDWKQKVESYKLFVHDVFAESEQEQVLLDGVAATISELMKTFATQLSFLQQLQDKSNNLLQQAERKRRTLVSNFERGNAPVLVDDMDEDDFAVEF